MEEIDDCALAGCELIEGASRLGLDLTAQQQAQFESYCRILSLHNTRMNLTAVRTAGGIMRTLFLDSLTIAPALPSILTAPDDRNPVRVVDVGSGAGIPGLPLKIVFPWWSLTMIESVGKKARFLQTAVQEMRLGGVEVLQRRAEDAGRVLPWRDAADLCVARAVAALASLLELCSPLVRPGGYLALPKSGDLTAELRDAEAAMKAVRLELAAVVPVANEIGVGTGRVIVLYRKRSPTPSGYPRRVGLAQSQPIGVRSPRRGSSPSNP